MNHLKPVKTSNRTKAQIVCEKELELYSHLIYNPEKFPSTSQRHIDGCPCQECGDCILRGILDSMKKDEPEEMVIERFIG